jgi:hypothetical protein
VIDEHEVQVRYPDECFFRVFQSYPLIGMAESIAVHIRRMLGEGHTVRIISSERWKEAMRQEQCRREEEAALNEQQQGRKNRGQRGKRSDNRRRVPR